MRDEPRLSSYVACSDHLPRAVMTENLTPDSVLIVDDHSLVRDGLRTILHANFPDCQIFEASGLDEATAILREVGEVDLVLLDLNMPDVDRMSGLEYLRSEFPSTPVVMITGAADQAVMRDALAAGATGFIPKSMKREAILEALEQIMLGEIYVPEIALLGIDSARSRQDEEIHARIDSLTPQQRIVLGHLVNGKLNKQIAHELDVSMTTVKAHVSAVLQKMNVFSRTQAVIMANRIGFHG